MTECNSVTILWIEGLKTVLSFIKVIRYYDKIFCFEKLICNTKIDIKQKIAGIVRRKKQRYRPAHSAPPAWPVHMDTTCAD